jgi:dipeptidyl aminopeptidase/acylaminoacyl peptidase
MRTARCALLLTLALTALACEPAAATFPGRNGDVVLSYEYGSRYSNQHMSLLRYPPRSGRPREVMVCSFRALTTPVQCLQLGRTAFTADGTRIAVSVSEGNGQEGIRWALWTLNTEGQRIDRVPLSAAYRDVRWAPDESALLAVRETGVFILNRDGSERSLLASDASAADWCADGRVVVAQHGEIWLLDVTRPGGARRLTYRGGADPSCSPHSRQVTFTRRDAIWTIPTKGGRARRLTDGFAPAWSPDGKQIAYLRNAAANYDVETNLYRIGLRRLVVRRVSRDYLMSDDLYSDAVVQDPDWQPLPRR